MSLEYYAKKLVTFNGETVMPGERIPKEQDPTRDYQFMVLLGVAEAREVESRGGSKPKLSMEPEMASVTPVLSPPKAETPDEADKELTRQELIELLPEGVSLDDLEGSGSNGYVTKADLEAYLNSED